MRGHGRVSEPSRHSGWPDAIPGFLRGPRTSAFTLVCLILVLACYAGILARMSHHLSSFWPANAVLAGVMVRYPALNRPVGWVGAFVAFMAADLSTGGEWGVTFGLTFANMAGAVAIVALAQRWPRHRLRLGEPRDVLALGGLCAVGALAATIAAIPISMAAFNATPVGIARSWFANELASYLAILPAVLTAPRLGARIASRPSLGPPPSSRGWLDHWTPVLALPVAVGVGVWIGGPMALMIILPLLLWSAVRGDVFQTAVLGLLATGWNMIAIGSGITEIESFGTASAVSVKLCLAFLAAGPLAVAAAVTSREEALRQVDHLARHDTLTGLRNRRAFLECADAVRRDAAASRSNIAVFMVDLDHFKAINDRFGHPTGDALLAAVGSALSRAVTPDAVLGRLGGEEFAMVVAGLSDDEATAMGERLRTTIAGAASATRQPRSGKRTPDDLASAQLLSALQDWPISASVGVANVPASRTTSIHTLLTSADRQLYEAKHSGRDQLRTAPSLDPQA